MDLTFSGCSLKNLCQINVILGKNGSGKSRLLKRIEHGASDSGDFGITRYVSPERGGNLVYAPNVDQAISKNKSWIGDTRRKNQAENFREQSATLFRRLELLVLREIEETHSQEGYVPKTFDTTVSSLNTLLDRVKVERDSRKAFRIVDSTSRNEVSADSISSGEAELISLGIEFLVFAAECDSQKENIFFVDEPDAHLHPDLQYRLAQFILSTLKGKPARLVLATHSTALLAGLSVGDSVCVAFMRSGTEELTFKRVTDVDRAILPIFGAHPLSNIFNEAPPLLVEGEDDERIWQQAVRSSRGAIRIYPCPVDTVDALFEYERETRAIIDAIYDNAIAYSLRDRDATPEYIDDFGPVIRMRLSCRAAENLMLSDDVLAQFGIDWDTMKRKIEDWAASNQLHQYNQAIQAFLNEGALRKTHDLKEIRNILIGLLSNKPWEVIVGQAIAKLRDNPTPTTPNSIRDYLGEKVCEKILRLKIQ